MYLRQAKQGRAQTPNTQSVTAFPCRSWITPKGDRMGFVYSFIENNRDLVSGAIALSSGVQCPRLLRDRASTVSRVTN